MAAAERVKPGDLLLVRDAHGADIHVRAVSGLRRGRDFPVVEICSVDYWPGPDRSCVVPWPAESVLEIVEEVPDVTA